MVEAKFREEHLIASLPDTSIFLNTSLKLFFHIGITHKWMKELCSERSFSRERKSFLSTYRKANEGFKKTKHVKFSEKRTFLTPRNVRFFKKFGVLCLLETAVLRFALLPYYRRFLLEKKFWDENCWFHSLDLSIIKYMLINYKKSILNLRFLPCEFSEWCIWYFFYFSIA